MTPVMSKAIYMTRVGATQSKTPVELVANQDEEAGNSVDDNRST